MNWYVLQTKAFHEKKLAERLKAKGIEHYLPIQTVRRKWSDRIKNVDKVVIPRVIFIHCEENERVKVLQDPSALAYLMDRSTNKPAQVPQSQMNSFMMVMSQREIQVGFSTQHLKPGMQVVIDDAIFDRVEAELVEIDGEKQVVVRILQLGCATLQVPLDSIRPKETP